MKRDFLRSQFIGKRIKAVVERITFSDFAICHKTEKR